MTGVERRHLELADGTRLSWLVVGEGPPVVMLPGWTMDATWWVDDGYAEALAARGFRVVAVDPLGSGESDGPLDPAAYADDHLVNHLGAVLEAEKARRATLWGWGRGAMLGQLYARRRPHDLELVVSGGDYLDADRSGLGGLDVDVHRDNDELIAALERGDWGAVFERLGSAPEWYRTRVVARNDPLVLAAVLRSSRRRALGYLPSMVPTVAIWGSDEPMARHNLELAETMPLADFVVVPGDRYEAYLDVESQLAGVARHLPAVPGSGAG